MSARYSATIHIMVKAAEKAGRALRRDFGEIEHLQVSQKGPGDFVTHADKRSEKILFEELQASRPDYGFLMEESDEIEGSDKSHRFIIDPLDGTLNFMHGIPHWAISIALEEDGEIIAGVILDPIKDELFWAEKGAGAFSNSRRLRVSSRKDFTSAAISAGLPSHGWGKPKKFVNEYLPVARMASSVTSMGSAALDLAYVAAGRYDAYWCPDLSPWDIAAGGLMVREAGGMISDKKGNRDFMSADTIVAANMGLHADFVKLLNTASQVKKTA